MYKTNGIYVNTCMFVRMYGLDSCMYVYAPHPFFFSLLSFLSSIDGRPASRTAKAQQNQKKRERTVNARIYVLFTEHKGALVKVEAMNKG